jgi:branched-chain amino acid transport system ATP-binding protein
VGADLVLHDVSLSFGGIIVLDRVSLTAAAGSIYGLVGPNGAGKTSLFNCISGLYRPTAGTIRVGGIDTLRRPAWKMARSGVARTFQHPVLRLDATVLENVMLGGHSRLPGGPVAWSLRLPRVTSNERMMRDEALSLLRRFGLDRFVDMQAASLPYGLHKNLELCRAMLAHPDLLLLDEPAAGLAHNEVEDLIDSIRTISTESKVTIVIVEHHMGLITALTDRVIVLDHGKVLMEGTARDAQADPRVIEAYLGQEVSGDESAPA